MVRSAKNSTQIIKTGGFHSKDVRQNRSKKESTPLITHCQIYVINVKMSGVERLLCDRSDLPANDGMYYVSCYNLFRKIPMDTSQSRSCRPSIDESLQDAVEIMKAVMCLTWTVAELYSIYVDLGHLSKMLVNLVLSPRGLKGAHAMVTSSLSIQLASLRQGVLMWLMEWWVSSLLSCVWRTVSSQSSHHPQ